ncbi:hypothetical protein ACM55H_07815 [Flavobacterium sp. ZT3R17]|uniref:hypothetical protein n=1 Tax=Flavobacterium cryoconiti TaxID=3398736 RepID=UPI003A8C0BB7
MIGLIGVAIASFAANSSSVPMLIDCYSGLPSFLSNNEIKVMLIPYPELLKGFKSSKKNSEDIKAILKSCYQEVVEKTFARLFCLRFVVLDGIDCILKLKGKLLCLQFG